MLIFAHLATWLHWSACEWAGLVVKSAAREDALVQFPLGPVAELDISERKFSLLFFNHLYQIIIMIIVIEDLVSPRNLLGLWFACFKKDFMCFLGDFSCPSWMPGAFFNG